MFKGERGEFQELCVDDICVTRDQFAEVFGEDAAAGATAGDGQLLEAPAAPSASGGSPNADNASTTTASEIVPITSGTSTPANDNPQPQGAEQSSYDGNDPVADENIPIDTQLVEGPEETTNQNRNPSQFPNPRTTTNQSRYSPQP